MPDRRLEQEFRKVWESAFGANGAQQRRRVDAVINQDSTVNPDALRSSLPWMPRDIVLPGAVTAGTNIARLAFPQGGRIRHVLLAARVAPSGGPVTVTIASASDAVTFSLPAGTTRNPAGADLVIDVGGDATVSVNATNGVEDLTISTHYTVGGS